MGSYLQNDWWGIDFVIILQYTLDKDHYGPILEFEMVRKLSSAYSNIWGSMLKSMAMLSD